MAGTGTGNPMGPGGAPTPGPATSTQLNPGAVAVDAAGNLYIADFFAFGVDTGSFEVVKVSPAGTLSVVPGTYQGTGEFGNQGGIAADAAGNIYIAEGRAPGGNFYGDVVDKVTAGTVSVVAGAGPPGAPTPGPAIASDLYGPGDVAVDASGNLYIADNGGAGFGSPNNAVEKVTSDGALSIVAGTPVSGPPTPGPATTSELGPFDGVSGVAVDTAGDLYIADSANGVVEKVTPDGILAIVAGTGTPGRPGPPTPGPATGSKVSPAGVAVDNAGDLYIADDFNEVVEKVTPGGILSIVAGTGTSGPPTPGPATSSDLADPGGVAVDAAGDLYIADSVNNVVERVTPGGILAVVAGTGTLGPPAPGPATSSPLANPAGVAVDIAGNLYIADNLSEVVEKVTPQGVLSIVAGTGNRGAPTPGPATSSPIGSPTELALDAAGNLYIADGDNRVVEEVTPGGILSIVAGTGTRGPPTPGPATDSDLGSIKGVAADANGNLYIADGGNSDVEEVIFPPA